MTAIAALAPVVVPKPWGREVWYSGIEARGESGVWFDGKRMALSAFLAAHQRSAPPVLLKALEPSRGDLYLELHERKHEVYIVDRVDEASDGLLLGVDATRRHSLGDAAFRARLLAAARQGEAQGCSDGVAEYMNRVVLQPGDAVAIPPLVPHSLRRGAHVIEFQTPVFERRILAASQPVATQAGWDSATAVAVMDASTVPEVVPRTMARVQTLARAPDFAVTRHRLPASAALALPPWAVGWVAAGAVRGAGAAFPARSAFITCAAASLAATEDAELLLAEPAR